MARFVAFRGKTMDHVCFRIFNKAIFMCRSHTKEWTEFGVKIPFIKVGTFGLDFLPTLFIGRYAVIVAKLERYEHYKTETVEEK